LAKNSLTEMSRWPAARAWAVARRFVGAADAFSAGGAGSVAGWTEAFAAASAAGSAAAGFVAAALSPPRGLGAGFFAVAGFARGAAWAVGLVAAARRDRTERPVFRWGFVRAGMAWVFPGCDRL
jgi:hypothetical protein